VRVHLRKPFSRSLVFGHALFTIPILLAFAACAVTKQYWLQPKYVIFSAPFALLFVAEAYVAISPAFLRRGVAVLGGAVCLIALIHFWTPTQYGRREDWRGAAVTLRARMTPNSVLLLAPGGYGLLNYYWPEAPQYWRIVNPDSVDHVIVPNDFDGPKHHGPTFYNYLWSDIRRNDGDPQDRIRKRFMSCTSDVDSVQFNPRFKLYHARVQVRARIPYPDLPTDP
jgi:hypothetical protein